LFACHPDDFTVFCLVGNVTYGSPRGIILNDLFRGVLGCKGGRLQKIASGFESDKSDHAWGTLVRLQGGSQGRLTEAYNKPAVVGSPCHSRIVVVLEVGLLLMVGEESRVGKPEEKSLESRVGISWCRNSGEDPLMLGTRRARQNHEAVIREVCIGLLD
jgi:hypothetical protein